LLGCPDRLARVAHFLHGRRRDASNEEQRGYRDWSAEHFLVLGAGLNRFGPTVRAARASVKAVPRF
jgi:hypothetical protein